MYSTKQMHDIAQAIAIEKGPRLIRTNGQTIAAYGLKKKELLKIFTEHNFSTRRNCWLNIIKDWGSDLLYWNDLVASNFFQDNSWESYVVFVNLSKDQMLSLQMFAENNNARAIGRAEDWESSYDLSDFIDVTSEAKSTKQEFFSGAETP